MHSDSVKDMSASLTRITHQASRTFDLNAADIGVDKDAGERKTAG